MHSYISVSLKQLLLPRWKMPKHNQKQVWVDHVWYQNSILSIFLLPLAFLYYFVISVRKHIYFRFFYQTKKYSRPVIIVGNITVGGTGKTPMVIHLCQQLSQLGYRPAVTSRGYGVVLNHSRLVTDADTAVQVGDEPLLIYKNAKVPVMVGPNRNDSIQQLIEHNLCDLVICDDGLQDYRFMHDLEICMVDSARLFGNGRLIPSGPLREKLQRIFSCDFVVATGSTVPAISADTMTLEIGDVVSLSNQQQCVPIERWQNRTVHAVAGIGHPQRFFATLRKHNITLIEHVFADHAIYNKSDFQFNDQLPILMTEKDAVKCLDFNLENAWYITVKPQTSHTLIERIHSKLREHDG